MDLHCTSVFYFNLTHFVLGRGSELYRLFTSMENTNEKDIHHSLASP